MPCNSHAGWMSLHEAPFGSRWHARWITRHVVPSRPDGTASLAPTPPCAQPTSMGRSRRPVGDAESTATPTDDCLPPGAPPVDASARRRKRVFDTGVVACICCDCAVRIEVSIEERGAICAMVAYITQCHALETARRGRGHAHPLRRPRDDAPGRRGTANGHGPTTSSRKSLTTSSSRSRDSRRVNVWPSPSKTSKRAVAVLAERKRS